MSVETVVLIFYPSCDNPKNEIIKNIESEICFHAHLIRSFLTYKFYFQGLFLTIRSSGFSGTSQVARFRWECVLKFTLLSQARPSFLSGPSYLVDWEFSGINKLQDKEKGQRVSDPILDYPDSSPKIELIERVGILAWASRLKQLHRWNLQIWQQISICSTRNISLLCNYTIYMNIGKP